MLIKNSNDTIRNGTHDLPACSAVSQPTALPCTPEAMFTGSQHPIIKPRAGLCPWDNRGKANSWRPPPPVHKNLPHIWTTMRQQCYKGKAEMWSVRAMHTFSCPEISSTMLQCCILMCGQSVTAFSAPPPSRRPGQGPRSPHSKASTDQTLFQVR
jgi:hypothetical protein